MMDASSYGGCTADGTYEVEWFIFVSAGWTFPWREGCCSIRIVVIVIVVIGGGCVVAACLLFAGRRCLAVLLSVVVWCF